MLEKELSSTSYPSNRIDERIGARNFVLIGNRGGWFVKLKIRQGVFLTIVENEGQVCIVFRQIDNQGSLCQIHK